MMREGVNRQSWVTGVMYAFNLSLIDRSETSLVDLELREFELMKVGCSLVDRIDLA